MKLPWYLRFYRFMKGLTTPGMLDNTYDMLVNSPSTGSGSNLWSLLTGSDNIFGLIGALTNRITAQHMTGADREAAELSYQQQEQFFNDYQSIPAQVQQSMEAGLNPALMYGKGATPMSPIAGNAQASQPSLDPGQLLSMIANLDFRAKEVKADTALKHANIRLINSQAKINENEEGVWAERYDFWKQLQTKNLADIDADIFLKNAQTSLANQGVNESEARSTLLKYQSDSAKVEADFAERNLQSLLDLRKSAQELNEANADYARSGSAESKQRLTELQQSWGTRWRTLQESLRKMSAEAGMSEKEAEAFWSDKRLNELLVLSEIYDNYKGELRVMGIGGTTQNWLGRDKSWLGGSMYPSVPFFPGN